jgi:hypothetical protein
MVLFPKSYARAEQWKTLEFPKNWRAFQRTGTVTRCQKTPGANFFLAPPFATE